MKSKNPATKHFFALFTVVLAVAAAGCDDGGKADLANGEELFTAKCAACHVLNAAGAKGQVGPNLDDSFRSARAEGMNAETVASVVEGQIARPGPAGRSVEDKYVMPAEIVTGEDARDVAAYVGSVAGVEGGGDGEPATGGAGGGGAVDGKTIFTQNCGSCHTLADAGTAGAAGPKLDAIGKQGDKYIETAIVDPDAVIAKGYAKGGMPAIFGDQLSPEELQALVDYLLKQK